MEAPGLDLEGSVAETKLSVVITSLQEIDSGFADTVNDPVLLGQPSRPGTREHVFDGLWFTDPAKGIPEDGLDQIQGTERDLPVGFHPVTKILTELRLEDRFSPALV